MKLSKEQMVWAVLRILLGFIFLWAFLDKTFGLGFATKADQAWLSGGSPTYGALTYGTHGPFKEFFQSIAGTLVVDWLFMIGLLCIGLSLILGIGVRIAGYSGALMLVLMYLALALPPEHNPLIDDHIINAILMIAFTFMPVGEWWGFGEWWGRQSIVKKYPILK